MTIYSVIGILGVTLYMGAYALLQTGYLRGSGYAYTIMNMLAAACVAISLIEAFNLSSLLIQVSWITISIVGLTRMYLINRSLGFTSEELAFHEDALPLLTRRDLRRFLDQGQWDNLAAGSILTRQNDPVVDLLYVIRGQADVFRQDTKIARIVAGNFVGEMTCLHGGPATATVVSTEPMRVFRVSAERLRAFLPKHTEIYDKLERSFAEDLRRKLTASGDTVTTLRAASA